MSRRRKKRHKKTVAKEKKSYELSKEDQAFSSLYDLAPTPPPTPPISRKQAVTRQHKESGTVPKRTY
jgi:hypothetical protein